MSSQNRARGRLPQRVYWTRRVLVLVVAFALVFGIARLLGAGGGSPDQAVKASSTGPTGAGTAAPTSPAVTFGPALPKKGLAGANASGASDPSAKPSSAPAAPLASPSGPCLTDEITATPVTIQAAAGSPIALTISLTGTQAACTFTVSPTTLAVKVADDSGMKVWSSQDCQRAIAAQQVVVRSAVPATVTVGWNGRHSGVGDQLCSASSDWVGAGVYQTLAAVIGSEPTTADLQLTLPARPVVTQTASPTPGTPGASAAAPAAGAAPATPAAPTTP